MGRPKKVKETTCPSGHKLPHLGCSPLVCVKSATALSKAKVERGGKHEEKQAKEAIGYAIARKKVRAELVPVPVLEGADAEEWVEKKKVSLLPKALSEVEFQLDYGDNKERSEAARDVLRMNGMLNRDAPTGVAPTVIIQMANGQTLPWLTRKEEKTDAKVIEAATSGGKKG